MANLNDVNRKITEITNALHDLSDEQMKSVERSVYGYLNVKDLIDKSDKAKDSFYTSMESSRALLNKSDDSVFASRKTFLTQYQTFFTNGSTKIKNAAKRLSKDSSNGAVKTVAPKKDITKDDTNAFLREKNDTNEVQIELLKSINDKIGNLTSTKSGGIMDFIFSILPKLIQAGSLAEGAGAIGAGLLGTGVAAKYAGKFKKFSSIAGGAKNLISKVPKTKGALAIAGVAGLTYAGTQMFSGDDSQQSEQVEQRYKGGSVKAGKPYVVGELGAEMFVPNSSGKIVPANRMGGAVTTDTLQMMADKQTESLDSNISKTMGIFSKPFDKNIKKYAKGIGEHSDTLEEKLEKGFQYIKDGATTMVNGAIDKINAMIPDIIKNNGVIGKILPQPTPSSESPKAPPLNNIPQNYSGAFNVPETGIRKIHDGEMIVPAYQAEMIRSASELKNDYSLSKSGGNMSVNPGVMLDEKFWMEKFVPMFAKAIKVDKKSTVPTRFLESTANPFG